MLNIESPPLYCIAGCSFTIFVYYAVVLILFVGPQDRQHNFALNAFWVSYFKAFILPVLYRKRAREQKQIKKKKQFS